MALLLLCLPMLEDVSLGRFLTEKGKSHSCEIPTRLFSNPSLQTISVAEGNIILRGQKVSSAYQSLSFYPNTYLRLGSASPSILDFENIITDEDGNYEIHLSAEKQDYKENWFHLNGQKGGMIALRSYRPPYGEKLIYPSVELNGKIIQEEQIRIFNNQKIES